MNKVGISSACFYPLVTEQSLKKICDKKIEGAELFLNSPSELNTGYLKELKTMKDNSGTEILSVHPFMSFAESFFLFSSYERRFYDIMPLYEKFFEAMQLLDSKIFVIHGSKIPGSVNDETYFERFAKLIEKGKTYGISVCQENVVHHRSETADYLKRMADYIGSDFGIVLDIKQARRAEQQTDRFLELIGSYVRHIHISDFSSEKDCIPPLEGSFDFKSFFAKMNKLNYNGAYIIELYEHSYTNEEQIFNSYSLIKNLLKES